MTSMKESLTARLQYLLKLSKTIEKRLKKAPDGTLRISSDAERTQYYLRKTSSDRFGTYLTKKNMPLIEALAQKNYDEKVLKSVQQEIKAIEAYLKKCPSDFPEEIYMGLRDKRKEIVVPFKETDEMFLKRWNSVSYIGKDIKADEAFVTDRGEIVRSKSEIIIANTLAKEGIPYRYEYPLMLKGLGTIRPDFTCLNIRTRKEYIWEHFGMMDNIAYANKNIVKIESYEQSGYYLGKNMIMTFETSQHAISSNIIKAMIEEYLV